MNNHYDELIDVLEKELAFHGLLISAAFAMNEALRSRVFDEIQKASRQYDECTCRIEDLEEKRLSLSDLICGDAKGGATHASLRSVIEQAPAGHKDRVAQLRAQLKDTVGKLSKVNYSNRVLLQESLYTISKTFEMVATMEASRLNGYKKQGTKDRSRITKTIVNTVA
jgi:hypothetical protein